MNGYVHSHRHAAAHGQPYRPAAHHNLGALYGSAYLGTQKGGAHYQRFTRMTTGSGGKLCQGRMSLVAERDIYRDSSCGTLRSGHCRETRCMLAAPNQSRPHAVHDTHMAVFPCQDRPAQSTVHGRPDCTDDLQEPTATDLPTQTVGTQLPSRSTAQRANDSGQALHQVDHCTTLYRPADCSRRCGRDTHTHTNTHTNAARPITMRPDGPAHMQGTSQHAVCRNECIVQSAALTTMSVIWGCMQDAHSTNNNVVATNTPPPTQPPAGPYYGPDSTLYLEYTGCMQH